MGIFLNKSNIERRAIGDNFPTEPVEDVPSRRSKLTDSHPVPVGSFFVLNTIGDLQEPETQNDNDKEKQNNYRRCDQPLFQLVKGSVIPFFNFLNFFKG
jgi:hypothetical protein